MSSIFGDGGGGGGGDGGGDGGGRATGSLCPLSSLATKLWSLGETTALPLVGTSLDGRRTNEI